MNEWMNEWMSEWSKQILHTDEAAHEHHSIQQDEDHLDVDQLEWIGIFLCVSHDTSVHHIQTSIHGVSSITRQATQHPCSLTPIGG